MAFHLKRRAQRRFSLSTASGIFMLLWIAEQKGFLHDRKVLVDIDPLPYSHKALAGLIERSIDCAGLVEVNTAYLGYIAPADPIKCIASVERRTADSLLIRHEKGRDLQPQDLEGRTVGFMPRTTSHVFLMRFLEHYKLDKQSLRLKPISPQEMGNALIRGDVDAISNWHPHVHNTCAAMDELGLAYAHFENTGFYKSEVVLATSKTFLVRQGKALRNLFLALQDAQKCLEEDFEAALPILRQKLKFSGDVSHKIWDCYRPALRPVGSDYLDNIHTLADWIRENDTEFMGRERPSYSDYIDNSLFIDTFGAGSI